MQVSISEFKKLIADTARAQKCVDKLREEIVELSDDNQVKEHIIQLKNEEINNHITKTIELQATVTRLDDEIESLEKYSIEEHKKIEVLESQNYSLSMIAKATEKREDYFRGRMAAHTNLIEKQKKDIDELIDRNCIADVRINGLQMELDKYKDTRIDLREALQKIMLVVSSSKPTQNKCISIKAIAEKILNKVDSTFFVIREV